MMAAVPPGGDVLCVGTGPALLCAAKRLALDGYRATVVAGASKPLYHELLFWDEPSRELESTGKLVLLESITGADEGVFDKLVGEVAAVVIAVDADEPMTSGLVDVVLPPTSRAKRVVALTRNLNGNGLGFFTSASKTAANDEVWAGGGNLISKYQEFEDKVKTKAAELGADVVFCRCGTLKGGGPMDLQDPSCSPASHALSQQFYSLGQQDLVNWRLLFDIKTNGVKIYSGDSAPGPGFQAVFCATSSEAVPGDTGRLGFASAVSASLRLEQGNIDFGVATETSREVASVQEVEGKILAALKTG